MVESNLANNEEVVLKDLEMVQAAKKDSYHAELLLRRIYPKILQVVRSISGSQKHADDIAQLSALEIMSSLDNYAGKGTIEAWAGRITYRVSMRTLRKEARHRRHTEPLMDDAHETSGGPESVASRRQLLAMLETKMARIPDEQRTTFLLHVMNGYSVDEVAEITDSSRNTVKYRLKTAYRLMREMLLEFPALRSGLMKEIP